MTTEKEKMQKKKKKNEMSWKCDKNESRFAKILYQTRWRLALTNSKYRKMVSFIFVYDAHTWVQLIRCDRIDWIRWKCKMKILFFFSFFRRIVFFFAWNAVCSASTQLEKSAFIHSVCMLSLSHYIEWVALLYSGSMRKNTVCSIYI